VNSTTTGFSLVKPLLETYKQAKGKFKGIANSKKEFGNHYLMLSHVLMDLFLQYFLQVLIPRLAAISLPVLTLA